MANTPWFCPRCEEPNKPEWDTCHNCEYPQKPPIPQPVTTARQYNTGWLIRHADGRVELLTDEEVNEQYVREP